MKLPEMPSYPYIGQDWDDTARLLLEDWGKACYVAGEKQERALWKAATPVVPPSDDAKRLAFLNSRDGRHLELLRSIVYSTLDGYRDWIDRGMALAASPSPRTPEQPASGLCVRCHKQPGDRVVIGTGWICAGCATSDERET